MCYYSTPVDNKLNLMGKEELLKTLGSTETSSLYFSLINGAAYILFDRNKILPTNPHNSSLDLSWAFLDPFDRYKIYVFTNL